MRKGTSYTKRQKGYLGVTSCVGTVFEGKIKVKKRGKRKSKQLLNDLKEMKSYRKSKGENTR